jgi:hypothetical protein
MAGWRPGAVSTLWAVILGLLSTCCQVHAGRMVLEPAVAATCSLPLFVFGASYMDVGQNSAAMPFREPSEFPPYGIDYFGRPTGRFSNGRLVIDHICEISLSLSLSHASLLFTPMASFTMRFAITVTSHLRISSPSERWAWQVGNNFDSIVRLS